MSFGVFSFVRTVRGRGFFLVGSWRGWTVLFLLGSAGNLNEGFWFWEPTTVGNGKEIVTVVDFLELISCSQDCRGSVGFRVPRLSPVEAPHEDSGPI